MENALPTILGLSVCCIVPLGSFFVGFYVAKYGSPISLSWRGFGQPIDEDEV